jgi:hypothetical protein
MSGTDYTVTPKLGLFKPNYNLDVDDWGTHLNDNADTLDNLLGDLLAGGPYLPLAGGTLTGPLRTIAGTGGTNLGLAVGAANNGIWGQGGGTGLAFQTNGTANLILATSGNMVGISTTMISGATFTLAADPATALQAASKQYVDNRTPITVDAPATSILYGRYNNGWVAALPIAGGTLTGPLILAADPSNALGAATKQYVDARTSAAYLPLGGGTLTGPLILAADPTNALGAATKQYVDTAGAVAAKNEGRNLLHNPLFSIQQRGAGPFTLAGAYTADRWFMSFVSDTTSIQILAAPDTTRALIGDEACAFMLRNIFTGNAAAAAFNGLYQRIEGTRRLSGKTVTFSFWAQASVALNLGVGLSQNFGTGGSPSPNVILNGQSVAATTTWQRYSVSFAVPSSAGKTFGTNGDDWTQLTVYFSSGATNAVITGNPGVQSGTVWLWGMQLEIGALSALDKPDPAVDWYNCMRFFRYTQGAIVYAYGAAGVTLVQPFTYEMRGPPAFAFDTQAFSNCVGPIALNGGVATRTCAKIQTGAVTATGIAYATFNFSLSADL